MGVDKGVHNWRMSIKHQFLNMNRQIMNNVFSMDIDKSTMSKEEEEYIYKYINQKDVENLVHSLQNSNHERI